MTTHANPTYEVDRFIHYCVANMPGAVPLSAHWPTHHGTHGSAEPHGQRRNGLQHLLDCQPATLDKRLVDVICAMRRSGRILILMHSRFRRRSFGIVAFAVEAPEVGTL
jgi:hypothetical protein